MVIFMRLVNFVVIKEIRTQLKPYGMGSLAME